MDDEPTTMPAPGRTGGAGVEMQVDGETFRVGPGQYGGTDYDWVSGPNPGYGFSSSRPFADADAAEHEESIRGFLSMIDPETGYIGD